MLEGWLNIPKVSTTPLPIPTYTSREIEVLIMSMFYKNNLLNPFLFSLDRSRWRSPLCSCGVEEQTAMHILTSCPLSDEGLCQQAMHHLSIANEDLNLDGLGTVAILNCSRDPGFIRTCGEILDNNELNLRRKIVLPSRS